MTTPILATKLFIPQHRPKIVLRPRLIQKLNEGLHRKLTLISAPAGFGKTTLISEWMATCKQPVAWLSLDEGDNDPTRFLNYLVAALQTIAPNTGAGVLKTLRSHQPPIESILTALLNDTITTSDNFILVLDDYHMIDAKPVDHALNFLLEHLPPQMHLIITTREDPNLPLAGLRARDQLTELRVADLRFNSSEGAEFLNRVMGLNLSVENIAALENRTEGWIAGLQLAALSMQGHQDTTTFIQSFTGSHHFVMDYLIEEVLQQQAKSVQTFLIRTSILGRLCGSLCNAILLDPYSSGQETLEYLERANLFIVPLDNERRWYRYHQLFADLLRQRLHQDIAAGTEDMAELHRRASVWFEDHGLEIEAFSHAAAANDIERAEHLIEGEGMPLQFRGAGAQVLNWLESFGDSIYTMAATVNLGQVQEADNQLHLAAETYQRVLQLAGDPPQPIACEAYLGLARITYEWNDLDNAQQHAQQCLQLTRQMDSVDTFASYGVFLARLKLAQRDATGAAAILAEAEAFIHQHNFVHQMPAVTAVQVLTLLQQGNLTAAAHLARTHSHVISQARVQLAQDDSSGALALLESLRQQVDAKGWQDEQLKVIVVQAVAYYANGENDKAVQVLGDGLLLAKPGGFIRIFVDEGLRMAELLSEAAAQGVMPDYIGKLLAVFEAEKQRSAGKSSHLAPVSSQTLIEPLSERELEVLRLLRTELNGPAIARELMISLNTMRSHTKNIYNKLGVNNRRTAVRRAEELDLL